MRPSKDRGGRGALRASALVPPTLRGYRPALLRGDVLAGATVWAVLVPEAIAYAAIAGVPPVVGLYAAPAALLLYALLGSSRQLVVGPMSATAALSAVVVGGAAATGAGAAALSAALALATGAIALAAGLLRLGFLAAFISQPVLKGFVVGIALTIIAGQLPELIGVEGAEGEFFAQLAGLAAAAADPHWPTLAVGGCALAALLLLKRLLPVFPASLAVVLAGIGATALLSLDRAGVGVVGALPAGLPALGPPDVPLGAYADLAAGAAGIALVGFAEGLGAAKTYAAETGDTVDTDRELIGMGGANAAAGLCSGMVVNGSLSKTAVNGAAGARSQVSGLTAALLTVVTLLFLTGLFEKLPQAVLAAVVIAAVLELIDVRAFRDLYGMATRRLVAVYGPAARADLIAAVAALLGVLVLGTLRGLLLGVAASLLLLLYRASRPNIAELGRDPRTGRWTDLSRAPSDEPAPGALVVRVEGGLFFADSDRVRERILAMARERGARTVVLDAKTVPFVDATAVRMLRELGRRLRAEGAVLAVARDIGQVRDLLGDREGLYPDVDTALREAHRAEGRE
ncbi:SulP family inorganic anion transporter [Nocardiopsis potens]|uniref:SulP family inorganic anion transporter n=1 Tax=Nocardiopsis potens TaxID=1246458 RepID=UPI0003453D19|nr:SulP family inorganic anion transporter [Nocardiopsis potens]